MDDPEVYTEVRATRVSSEEELRKALRSYSDGFEYNEAPEDAHQYLLFQPLPASLILVSHFPKTHPSLVANTVITFTSYSRETSRAVAEKFGELADLELLTEHEYKALSGVSTSSEETAFRGLVGSRNSKKTLFAPN